MDKNYTSWPVSVLYQECVPEWQKPGVKTRCTNCDPDCKKYYRRENISSKTNIQNAQKENDLQMHNIYLHLYSCETKGIIREKMHFKF